MSIIYIMKNLILILLLFLSYGLKAQQKPLYPEDRTSAAVTGLCVSGLSYPLIYSIFDAKGYRKNTHLKTVLVTSAISIGAAIISYNFGPKNQPVNSRQNLTTSLIFSGFTITLVRFGIGNSIN